MTIREFIGKHRADLKEMIRARVTRDFEIDDEEIRLWILNDEGLYLWARSEGVRI